jgi:voltage-gated potassium channel
MKMPANRVFERLQLRIGLPPRGGLAAARHEVLRFLRRLVLLIAALTVLVTGGAAAFVVFENTSYWDGLGWALDTVATVGSIPHPESLGGQITKIALISFGVGTMFFLLVTLTELFVAGDLSGLLEARRMQRKIADLKDHYQIARDLEQAGVPFVVIDANPEVREAVEEREVLHIDGRASEDEVLLEAGIERARAMIACIDSDAENIFATLTARELRPDLQIVARAAEEASERKLMAAGANDVVSPYKTSGRAMAQLALDAERGRREGAGHAPGRSVLVRGEVSSSAESTPTK